MSNHDQTSISILMPATRADLAAQSLRSLVAQTTPATSLLVSDNTVSAAVLNDQEVKKLVSAFNIQTLHAYPKTTGDQVVHGQLILDLVETDFFRIMFDDDLLAPLSTTILQRMCADYGVKFAIHNRYIFTDYDFSLSSSFALTEFVPEIGRAMSFLELARALFLTCVNFLGEPPFSMFSRDVIPLMRDLALDGIRIRYLSDVAIPLLVAEQYGSIGVSSARLGYFRRHAKQDSSVTSPVRLSGLVEWELISRYLNQRFSFAAEERARNKALVAKTYYKGVNQFPILADRIRVLTSDDQYIIDSDFRDFFAETQKLQGL
jgi:hypothetical protein